GGHGHAGLRVGECLGLYRNGGPARGAYRVLVIDTHCHLTFPDFQGRVPEVLRRAREAGVTGGITVSTSSRDCGRALALAEAHDRVWCTSGIHPLYSHEGPHDWNEIL